VRETFVQVYSCPSDPNIKLLLNPASYASRGPTGVPYMTGAYRGVAGNHHPNAPLPPGGSSPPERGGHPNEVASILSAPPGVSTRGPLHDVDEWNTSVGCERLLNIRDGTSNTLAVGERATRTVVNRGTFWANSFNLYSLSGGQNTSATLLNDYG